MSERENYLTQLQKRLDAWMPETEDLKAKVVKAETDLRGEVDRLLAEFRNSLSATQKRLDGLRDAGEEQWAEFRKAWDKSYLQLCSVGQRLTDMAESLSPPEGHVTRARFFLSPTSVGGWQLKKEGAKRPTKVFDRKHEGLDYSRSYVRARKPSQLIVRRQDGTFERTFKYGRVAAQRAEQSSPAAEAPHDTPAA